MSCWWGPPGIGQTHLATDLGVKTVRRGLSVRFYLYGRRAGGESCQGRKVGHIGLEVKGSEQAHADHH